MSVPEQGVNPGRWSRPYSDTDSDAYSRLLLVTIRTWDQVMMMGRFLVQFLLVENITDYNKSSCLYY